MIRTDDGGRSWVQAYFGDEDSGLLDLCFDASGAVGSAVGNNGIVLSTKDRGTIWIRQSTGFDGSLQKIRALDPTEAWITGNQGSLLHTTDGGLHWDVVVPASENAAKTSKDSTIWFSGLFFKNKQEGWVGGSDGIILKTEDSGRTWRLESLHKADFIFEMYSVDGRIFAVGKTAAFLQKDSITVAEVGLE